MSGAEDIEKIKLAVVDYLANGNLKGAVDYVRHIAPILGLSGAMKFVKQVQAEVEPAPNTIEQNGHIA
jgi:hypothetical protein